MFIETLKDTISNNKKIFIVILIIFVFTILLIMISKNKNSENKVFENKDYVFTYESKKVSEKKSKLPYINLDSPEIIELNNEFISLYYETIILENEYMDYDFYVYSNLLSLIINIYNVESDDFIANKTYFYNIDISTKSIINNDQIKRMFNVDDEYVKNKILEEIKEYYNYENEKGYISNCDFECYKSNLDNNFIDNVNYTIKGNSLYAYLYFSVDVNFAYDTNKPFDIYYFKLK